MNHSLTATRWLGAVVAAVAWLALAGLAQAQADTAPWRDTLTCDPARQTYQGLEYCTGLAGRAHVVVVDLHDTSGLRFAYVMAEGVINAKTAERQGVEPVVGECRDVNIPLNSSREGCHDPARQDYYPIMSLRDAVARVPEAALVINSDYGAGSQKEPATRGHGPEGLTVVRGQRLDGPLPHGPDDRDNNAVKRPWVALSADAPFRVEFGQLSADDGRKPYDWIDTGFGGSPWLFRNGERVYDDLNDCVNTDRWSCESAEAQAAVALSRDGRWLYFVVVNDVDAAGLTDFLEKKLDPAQAIKFDGGGSTQMWYGGLPGTGFEERVAFAESGRLLSQYLAVIAPPGDGIDVAPPVEPPPPPIGDDWWDGLWSDIEQQVSDWWARARADVGRRLDAWWQSAQEELLRAIETEINNLLGQLCGAAGLPAVVVGSLALARRRRRTG